jgi:5'-nucleotidase
MATLQGYFRKIPSMAVSLVFKDRNEELRFDIASQIAESLALGIRNGGMQTDAILNVNVPNLPRHQIKGIVATKTASTGYVRLVEARSGTDIWAVNEGFISITPLRLEVTHHNLIPAIAQYIQGLESDLLGTPPGDNK